MFCKILLMAVFALSLPAHILDVGSGIYQMSIKAGPGTADPSPSSGLVQVKKDAFCKFAFLRALQALNIPNNAVGTLGPGVCPSGAGSGPCLSLTFGNTVLDKLTVGSDGTVAGVVMVGGTATYSFTLTPAGPTGFLIGTPAQGGDPVSLVTGELYEDPPADLSLGGGPLGVALRRSYRSMLAYDGVTNALGTNWRHNFDVHAYIDTYVVTIATARGELIRFMPVGGGWVLASPHPLGYQLVGVTGGGFRFLNPSDNLIYTFASTGFLTRVEDRNGNALTVTQGPSGPTSVTDGLGRTLTFTYTNGLLTKVQDQTGRAVSYAHTGSNLTSFTDAAGKVTSYTVTSAGCCSGLITRTTLPGGNTSLAQTYSIAGSVSAQADGLGNNTALAYGNNVGDAGVKDPLGNITIVSHANLADFIGSVDANGKTTAAAFDANHRPISITDRNGNTSSAGYHDPSGYLNSFTDAAGNTTRFTYTGSAASGFMVFDLTGRAYPDGASDSSAYDANGNLVKVTDRAGKTTNYTYDARGRLLTVKNPLGGVTTYTYNADGTLATSKTPAGDTTSYSYDSLKRLSQVKYPDNSAESYVYDTLDRITQNTDPRSKVINRTYTDNGELKGFTDPLNNTHSLVYDAAENLSSLTTPAGTAKAAYNAMNMSSALTSPTGEATTFAYDKLNRVSLVSDAAGQLAAYTYDNEGAVTSITDGANRTLSITPDALGRTAQLITPLGETYKFSYDALSRPISIQDPLGVTSSFNYEPGGLFSSITLPGSVQASYSYDDLGNLTSVKDPNGNSWTNTYDNLGRLTSSKDPLGKALSVTYNSRNQVASATSPEGNVQLTYDALGNLTRRLYSDKTDLNYSFDANNRITSANGVTLAYDAAGRIANSNGLEIVRDASSRIVSIAYTPGKVTYTYNNRGLLASIVDWTGAAITFTYDASRSLASITRPNGVVTQYSYDGNGRLNGITESKGSTVISAIKLVRDAAGHTTGSDRTQPQSPAPAPGTSSAAFNTAHQISTATYDGLGRLTKDALRTYTWDLASRLTSYQGADGSASFTYDAFGRRISRTSPGVTENYTIDYALGLSSVAVVSSGGKDQRYYIHTPGGRLLVAINAVTNAHSYYHCDEMHNTLFLTDDVGTVTDSYGITPYGESVTQKGSTPNPFTWQGELGVMAEGATSLYYMRARYYDSTSARFVTRDPIDSISPGELNPYEYALGNPVSQADPTGLSPFEFDWAPGFPSGPSLQSTTASRAKKSSEESITLLGWHPENAGKYEDFNGESASATPPYRMNSEWLFKPRKPPLSPDFANLLFGSSDGGCLGDLRLEDAYWELDFYADGLFYDLRRGYLTWEMELEAGSAFRDARVAIKNCDRSAFESAIRRLRLVSRSEGNRPLPRAQRAKVRYTPFGAFPASPKFGAGAGILGVFTPSPPAQNPDRELDLSLGRAKSFGWGKSSWRP
jgi:RHS repeat-associated protein